MKARILSRIEFDTNGGCWLWTGAIMRKKGYGYITAAGMSLRAHRASYATFVGPIPQGMYVCHKCDVPSCVNPDHLFLGSPAENVADMMAKGRHSRCGPKGEAHGSAKLTAADVIAIRGSTETAGVLAERFCVSPSAIFGVRGGHTWRHVQ